MASHDKIAVLDFGGQYAHLIANRIRRLGVYSEILAPDSPAEALASFKGIIFSGGPHSVYDTDAPDFNRSLLELGKPVLGICYGHQLVCHALGGEVKPGEVREFGKAELTLLKPSPLFEGTADDLTVWMSHGDSVSRLPRGFAVTARTDDCDAAAVEHPSRRIFGVQFHPEVTHSARGMRMLDNFVQLCGCARTWSMKEYTRSIAAEIEKKTAGRNVFLLVSGGVDSVVAFSLLNRLLGEKRVLGLHIDNGLMRLHETASVDAYLRKNDFHNLRIADASALFLKRLKGVTDPEQKRKIIGDTFIDVQRDELARLTLDPSRWMLGQGTIYPDTIESGGTRHAAVIKTHHNRVPAIEQMIKEGRVIEPLAELYKDEVRELGRELGLSDDLVNRHPFPGPGLGVRLLCSDGKAPKVPADDLRRAQRIAADGGYETLELPLRSVGVQGDFRTYAQPLALEGPRNWELLSSVSTDITNSVRALNRVVLLLGRRDPSAPVLFASDINPHRLEILREADDRVTRFLRKHGLYGAVWQMPVVLIPVGAGTLKDSIVLRPVCSSEAMTADFYRMPTDLLGELTEEILGVTGVAAVYYDLTNKPPGTIEWE